MNLQTRAARTLGRAAAYLTIGVLAVAAVLGPLGPDALAVAVLVYLLT